MFRNKIPNPSKARRLEQKGDRFFEKDKFEKALQCYRDSAKFDPDRSEIYQKLSTTLEKTDKEWTQEDFEESMSWTMRQQELENPDIKWIHQKFSNEYQAVQKLLQQLMLLNNPEDEQGIIIQILNYQEKAALPILDFLLAMKNLAQHGTPPASSEEL
jgi:tetratricopeptide (TPR) repeat protein